MLNHDQKESVLASNPIEITTLYREDEPAAIAFSEPPKRTIMRRVNTKGSRGGIVEEDE